MRTERDGTAIAAGLAAGVALGAVALLFLMVIAFALPVLLPLAGPESAGGLNGLNSMGGPSAADVAGVTGGAFSWSWRPYQGEFGIMPMLAGSLALSGLTLCLAWPLALACACWSLTRTRGFAAGAFQTLVRLMAAVPTVVYGFAAVFLLTPLVREGLGGSGVCWLSASLMLTLLVLPTMILVLEAGLGERLESLGLGGLALGMTRLEVFWHVVLPSGRKALVAAALLGFGRAVGDTLLPLMLAGNAPQTPQALTDSVRALTAHMALVTANEVGGAAYGSLFAAGALLLLVNALVSLAAARLTNGRRAVEGANP